MSIDDPYKAPKALNQPEEKPRQKLTPVKFVLLVFFGVFCARFLYDMFKVIYFDPRP